MPRCLVLLFSVMWCLLAACGDTANQAEQPTVTSKYTQTWPKQYSATTCEEWASEMTEAQRWAAAADMLTAARNKGDGGTGLPTDQLVTEFQADVSEACSSDVDGLNVSEIGASIYLIGREKNWP